MIDSHSIRNSRIARVTEAHPVVAFFATTIAVSWSLWGLAVTILSSVSQLAIIPGGFGPAIAAIVVMWARGENVRSWLRDGLTPHVDMRWYAVALGLPIVFGLAMGGLLVLSGGSLATSQLLSVLPLYPISLLFTMLVGGGQEELGWRGLALPALQERFDALPASVLIGVGWAIWHLPLFAFDVQGYAGRSWVLYGSLVIGFSIIFTWLFNNTRGSILLPILLHGGINAASSLGGAAVHDLATTGIPIYVAYGIPVWSTAVALLVWCGPKTLSTDGAITVITRQNTSEVDETVSDTSM